MKKKLFLTGLLYVLANQQSWAVGLSGLFWTAHSVLNSFFFKSLLELFWVSYFLLIAAVIFLMVKCRRGKKFSVQLAESEERYKLLSNLTCEGILIHCNGLVVDANEPLCIMLQCRRDEIVGKSLLELFPSVCQDQIEAGFSGESSLPYEVEISRRDNTVLSIEIATKNFYASNKNLKVSAIRDFSRCKKNQNDLSLAKEKVEKSQEQLDLIITHRERVEERLHASEEKFAVAFHNSPVLICITDIQTGEYLDVNEEAIRVSGFSRDEILGNTAENLGWITIENRSLLIEDLRRNGCIVDHEMEFRAKDGSVVAGLVRGEQVTISGRDCLLTVTMDITSRKKSDRALLTSKYRLDANEKKYRDLYESLNDAFVQIDLEGRFMQFNKAFLDMLAYSADEIHGLCIYDVSPAKWHEYERNIIQDAVLSGAGSRVYEKEYLKKDGSLISVELRVSLVCNAESEPEALWAIVRDITERKTTEKELAKYSETLEGLVVARTSQLQAEIEERERFEKELTQRTAQLELFNKAMIDREMRIIEMKIEVNDLCRQLGIELAYEEFWNTDQT